MDSNEATRCPPCGANLALVGRLHRCVTLGGVKRVEPSATVPHKVVPNVPNSGVPNSDRVPNKQLRISPQSAPPSASAAARVARWKAVNQERYRVYMRELMRRRRERAREARQ
jgi:hypothetical protein